jgi:hypothetical protein
MEIYYEKNVTNESIDKHKKRNIVLNVLKVIGFIVMFLIIAIFINFVEVDNIIVTVFMLTMLAFTIAFEFIIFRLLRNLNVEYDYYILGDIFRIVCIYNRKKRKKLIEIPTSSIASIGFTESETFDRYDADKDTKRVIAFCNEYDVLYIFTNRDGEKKLILVESDPDFAINLKRALHPTVIDNSFKEYLLKIQKKNKD